MNARKRSKLLNKGRKAFLRAAYKNCIMFNIPPHKKLITADEYRQFLQSNGGKGLTIIRPDELFEVIHIDLGIMLILPANPEDYWYEALMESL